VSDIQRESQAVLNSIKENDSHSAFKAWKKWWNPPAYIPKGTILKEMADKIEWVKPAFLFWPSPGTFRYTSYLHGMAFSGISESTTNNIPLLIF
jgi:hypothetical protein